MDEKRLLEIKKARQEVADIFSATLLDMILAGKAGLDKDANNNPRNNNSPQNVAYPMEPQLCR